jgi:hypothetical protein
VDELFQVVIFVAILALGLLAGRKKKRHAAPRPPPPRTAARRPTMPAGSPSATAVRTRRPASPPGRRKTLEETLLELLGQQLPEPVPPAELEGHATEAVPEPEARTLESVEMSSEARHARFHERYVAAVPPPKAAEPPRLRLSANPRSLREAVIWKAVLGRPKGLEP